MHAATRLPLSLVCSAALLLPGAGSAGEVGTWTRVTPPTLSNTGTIGLARSRGGLQLVWLQKNGTKTDLVHSSITASGGLGPAARVVAGWGSLTDGSIATTASGLQAFFSGIRSTSTSDPYSGGTVYTASARASGGHWTLGSTPTAALRRVRTPPTGSLRRSKPTGRP
jgi:hypothetical protein